MSLFTTFSGVSGPTGGMYSRSHLHSLAQAVSGRPAQDDSLSSVLDPLLTLAQSHYYGVIAAIAPEALYGPPTLLQTDDGGVTYNFGKDDTWQPAHAMGHIELLRGREGGPVLLPGVSWAPQGFLVDGGLIRWADGRARVFREGLYARYVGAPGIIDESHEPTLMPPEARIPMLFRAMRLWAKSVRKDPREFEHEERAAWSGDPAAGDYGVLGRLRTQYNLVGAQAVGQDEARWWDFIDTGASYTRHG